MPYAAVRRVLRERVANRVQPAPAIEVRVGERLTIARDVEVEMGDVTFGSDATTVPLSVAAAPHPERFPTAIGRLVVRPVGDADTELRLEAIVTHPFGAVGRFARAAGSGRVADRSLLLFFDDLVSRVTEAVEETSFTRPAPMPVSLRDW